MKCAQHIDMSAVGTCNSCGRGLCSECVAVFTPPLCGGCALEHNKGVSTSLWIQLALMGGLFIVSLTALVGKIPLPSAIGYALVAAFFPSGWRFLGQYFSPSGGYIYPMARWINLIFQACIAAFIGVVVGPIYLFKAWKELRLVRQTRKSVNEQ